MVALVTAAFIVCAACTAATLQLFGMAKTKTMTKAQRRLARSKRTTGGQKQAKVVKGGKAFLGGKAKNDKRMWKVRNVLGMRKVLVRLTSGKDKEVIEYLCAWDGYENSSATWESDVNDQST